MDVKVVYANPNGTLSILPDTVAGVSPWRPSSVSLAAVYLMLSSAAIASNLMVLTGIITVDRLRSPYAVLVSALCLQCAMDAAVGHCVITRELIGGGGGGGVTVCRGVATVTAALSAVELVTFAALACLNTFVRTDYAELPLPAAATLWAAPSMYTYVILTPTLLFTTRYFPSRYVQRRPTYTTCYRCMVKCIRHFFYDTITSKFTNASTEGCTEIQNKIVSIEHQKIFNVIDHVKLF